MYQVALRTGHLYLPLPSSPIENGERNAQADILFVERVFVGSQLPGFLGQSEAEIEVCFQPGVGTYIRYIAFTFQLPADHVLNIRVVFVRHQQGFVQLHAKVRHTVTHFYYQVFITLNAQIRAEFLHAVVHLDAGVHLVGFFGKHVEFQLEHFIFGDGADVVTPPGILIECVCVGIIE